jgi:hypothetical protein
VLDRGLDLAVDCNEVACDCGCTCWDSVGDDILSENGAGDDTGAVMGTYNDDTGDDANH